MRREPHSRQNRAFLIGRHISAPVRNDASPPSPIPLPVPPSSERLGRAAARSRCTHPRTAIALRLVHRLPGARGTFQNRPGGGDETDVPSRRRPEDSVTPMRMLVPMLSMLGRCVASAPLRAAGGVSLIAAARPRGFVTMQQKTVETMQAVKAAAAVVEEVSGSVSGSRLEAPDVQGSFVAMDSARSGLVDENGLPLVYDKAAIQKYWDTQGGALQQRWIEFLAQSVPWLTKVATMLLRGGAEELDRNAEELARDARISIEELGPTFVKLGQMLSVRPDVLPKAALRELEVLQASTARAGIGVAPLICARRRACRRCPRPSVQLWFIAHVARRRTALRASTPRSPTV